MPFYSMMIKVSKANIIYKRWYSFLRDLFTYMPLHPELWWWECLHLVLAVWPWHLAICFPMSDLQHVEFISSYFCKLQILNTKYHVSGRGTRIQFKISKVIQVAFSKCLSILSVTVTFSPSLYFCAMTMVKGVFECAFFGFQDCMGTLFAGLSGFLTN